MIYSAAHVSDALFKDERLVEVLSSLPKFVQVRVSNVLYYKEVKTLDDLCKLGPVDLLKSKNMGLRSLAALEMALEQRGLSLNGNRRSTENPTEYEIQVGRAVAVIHRRAVVLDQRFRSKIDEDIPGLAREIRKAADSLLRFLAKKSPTRKRRSR